MADDELEGLGDDERALYKVVPEDGSTISNPALRHAVGWRGDEDTDRYFLARDRLEDAGLIARGRGRGGTVRRVSQDVSVAPEEGGLADTPEEVAESLRRELDLYAPLHRVVAAEWAKDHRANPLSVEITALQGRRATGIWARPDIVTVEVKTFAYVPGKYLEVVTFEVKPSDAISVQAVYEALAHRRAATHSYVLLHVPADRQSELQSGVAEVAEVARAHGIGVVTVEDPSDYETWDERETALRVEPDPDALDVFIGKQLSEHARRRVSLALR